MRRRLSGEEADIVLEDIMDVCQNEHGYSGTVIAEEFVLSDDWRNVGFRAYSL